MRLLFAADRLLVDGIFEPEVVAQVGACEPSQIGECLVEREAIPVEVDVERRACRRYSRQKAGAALQQPLRLLTVGEDPAEKTVEVLPTNTLVGVQRGIGGRRLFGSVLDRSLDASGGGVRLDVSHWMPPAVPIWQASGSPARW